MGMWKNIKVIKRDRRKKTFATRTISMLWAIDGGKKKGAFNSLIYGLISIPLYPILFIVLDIGLYIIFNFIISLTYFVLFGWWIYILWGRKKEKIELAKRM